MEDRKLSPKLLVTWAIAGAVLAASTWFLSFVPIPRLPAHERGFWDVLWMNRLRFVAFFSPFALGVTISLAAERRFNRGFHDEIWSEAQLEPVRALVAKSIWSWASMLVLGTVIVSLIFSVRTVHTGTGAFIYILLFPIQTATRIRQLVTPKVKTTGVFMDWQSFKPIHSDHWGQHPIPPSE